MKYFSAGLVIGLLIAGLWFWNNPRIVENTHLQTITDTIYVQGIPTIDSVKKVSSGGVSVEKQPNPDPCVTEIDSVIITPEGGLIGVFSRDANTEPLMVTWSFPELTIKELRVDTIKVFELKTVEVEREVAWYGTPLAHAVYGIGIIALILVGN